MMNLRKSIDKEKRHQMLVQSILNHVQKFKSFVYGEVRLIRDSPQPILEVQVNERANSWALCSVCRQPASGYDRLGVRRFEFIPVWGIKAFLLYAPRRVNCATCGVKVEHMPWALGKRQLTRNYAWYLAEWAKRMSWQRGG
jgi:hypothetical protein